ncbi:hypothetical protein YTCETSXE_CDS0039 [Staphylococcus phage MVC_VPHSA2]|uniref:Uncharacterized protein n=1 Tax=Staphylococcus phage MVC_VPHSA1 TaxID=3088876 RepID=A0ABZ0QYR9_9CAUD|nr:hypothetical protein FBHYGVHD_CDS0094 [Staphylococcus phage MVC_VPHSA1]WPF64995.1 hypothetical protein YTCETSXE_CDS0039 [Staphylococcus phage MVC_VPHSA2]
MIKVGDSVKVKSFSLESEHNPTGEDEGVVIYIEKAFIKTPYMPAVQVKLVGGDMDNHKIMRFTFEEVTKIEDNGN